MQIHRPIVLDTIGALAACHHGIDVYCRPCRRWASLDLPGLVLRGYAGRKLVDLHAMDAWPEHRRPRTT